MSRQYAAVYTTIWQDPDFKDLSADAQRVYLLAVSQPNISWCGVVPFTARRWSTFAKETTAKGITKAVDELIGAGRVLLDEDTEELWVKGFVKHNVEKQPKLRQAALREFEEVHSPLIRSALVRSYGWLGDAQAEALDGASSEDAGSAVFGVGVQGSVSGSTPQPPDQKTPTPTPEAFVVGCQLAAEEQCDAWINRGSNITDRLGWIAARTKSLVRDRIDLLERVAPLTDVEPDEWRCLIQTGRFSEDTARTHPVGCDNCAGGWVYPEDETREVTPCPTCSPRSLAKESA